MCLTDKIFLQTHVTFCEYLVFHEFKRYLYITLRVISEKKGYDLNAYNNVRDILYNTDVITNIVKSIVHSPAGKLVSIIIICFCSCLILSRCEQT